MARANNSDVNRFISAARSRPTTQWSTIGCFRNSVEAPSTTSSRCMFELYTSFVNFGFSWSNSTSKQSIYHRKQSDGLFHFAQLTSTLLANKWYWIGGRWDGTYLSAWLNGREEARTASSDSTRTEASIFFGNSAGGTDGGGNQYAEVYVWYKALTDQDMMKAGCGYPARLIRPEIMLDGASFNRTLDTFRGPPLSVNGPPTEVAHPPLMSVPRRRSRYVLTAVAANQNMLPLLGVGD